jgi:hypothetical protein
MTDKAGLKIIGYLFGSITAMVMPVTMILVQHAIAGASVSAGHPSALEVSTPELLEASRLD